MYRLKRSVWLPLALLALLGCQDDVLDGGTLLGVVVVGTVSWQGAPVVDAVVTSQFPHPNDPTTTVVRTDATGEYATAFSTLLGSPGPMTITIMIEPPPSSLLQDTTMTVQVDLTRPPDTARVDVMLIGI